MDNSIITGLIGGFLSVVLISYISSKVRDTAKQGQLRYGWGIFFLACCCLGFVGLAVYALFYDKDAWEKSSELYAIIGLFIVFGLGAIYSFGEYFQVYGAYDNEGITFHTPWTGTKNEKWSDLDTAVFNAQANWYVLKFKTGSIIRLSNLLGGHGGVIELLAKMGYDDL